jgi:pyruvate dehydrogenase E1 component beta subunit
MVTPPHVPVPFADSLEDAYIPSAAKVEAAVRSVVGHRALVGVR